MKRSNRSPDYVRKVQDRIDRLRKELRWATLGSLQPDPLSRWLALQIRNGLGERTANHYLEAAIAFCNWCVAQRRLERNPIEHVSKATVIDPRCLRRAATIEELRRLLKASGKRALVYLTAVLTGLRRRELQQLQWGDAILDDPQPRLALRAKTTKSRRGRIPFPSHRSWPKPSGRAGQPIGDQPTGFSRPFRSPAPCGAILSGRGLST